MFWLLQGERDRDADQVEGLPLSGGGLGEHRQGGGGAGEPDLVAGQRGQVLQETAEATVGAACGVALAGGRPVSARLPSGKRAGMPPRRYARMAGRRIRACRS